MTPEFPYVQLPGSYRGFFRKASLWEGVDHILCVKGTRFHEEYRRFYYRDIQALIVEKRARAGSIGWWVILLGLFFVSLISAVENDPPYSWVVLLALSLLVLIRLEITFRRSCRCSIQTAVSREPLPSIIRRTSADAFLARLQGRIAAEQGELPVEIPPLEEQIVAALRPAEPATLSASAVLDQAALRERRKSAVRGVNLAILALFILLLNSVFTFFVSSEGLLVSQFASAFVGYSFIAIGLIPLCLSLQYLSGLRVLQGLRILLAAIIGLSVLRVVTGLALGQFFLFARSLNPQIFQRYYTNTNGALQLALAAGGLLLVFAKWETYRRGDASSS